MAPQRNEKGTTTGDNWEEFTPVQTCYYKQSYRMTLECLKILGRKRQRNGQRGAAQAS